jgi:tight adherence protein B
MSSVLLLAHAGCKSLRRWYVGRANRDADKFQSWSEELASGWDENKSRMTAWAANLGVPAAVLLIWLLTGRVVLALAAGVVIFKLPGLWFRMAREKRLEAIDQQLPNAISVMVASVRAGRSLRQAISDVAEKTPHPIGPIFGRMTEEINRGGISVERALERARTRTPVEGFTMVTTALMINCSKGGDVLHILERMADAIRELARLRQKIRTETAPIRSQEKCILLMTPVMGGFVCLFDPEIPHILFDEIIGNLVLVAVAVLQAISVLWIRRIIKTAI